MSDHTVTYAGDVYLDQHLEGPQGEERYVTMVTGLSLRQTLPTDHPGI